MTTRTITAIYDSESDARRAREQLVSRGLDDDDVRIVGQNLSSERISSDGGDDDKGFWESIKDFFVGDDDRPTYSEGLRRGGYLLTARVDDERSDEAISLLEQTNAVDLDERAEQWRAEGWTGADHAYSDDDEVIQSDRVSNAQDARDPTAESAGIAAAAGASMDTSSSTNARASTQGRSTQGNVVGEQAIPVAEERLRVGKREVNRGGVRVRSYVVEEPVHEQVALREEHVDVQRRPVSDRSVRAGDDVFRDQTIEISESGEEAVVAKDTVVTGEVLVRKTADERVEQVDETVRRTEVDVDDSRSDSKGNTARSGTRRRSS
ncbi:MAG: DUF2382 domain-containing protein [Povalibacter sp.]